MASQYKTSILVSISLACKYNLCISAGKLRGLQIQRCKFRCDSFWGVSPPLQLHSAAAGDPVGLFAKFHCLAEAKLISYPKSKDREQN